MKIESMHLTNFRNYAELSLSFGAGANVFYGANGQGKTNIIEALYFFCNGKSYRGAKDREVILFGEKRAELGASFLAGGRGQTVQIFLDDTKRVLLNGIGLERLSELVGVLKAVIFTPEHLSLVKSGPGMRRQFLDAFLSSLYPVYFKSLMAYFKALKQKNAYLKSGTKDDAIFDIWNERLSEYAAVIASYRRRMLNALEPFARESMLELSGGKEQLALTYLPSVKEDADKKDAVYEALNLHKRRELEMRMCLIGPHRDDFLWTINQKSGKLYGSQGQQRSLVIALKIAESEVIKSLTGEYPVLLLDDITSELDDARRSYLLEKIKGRQVFITCTERVQNSMGADKRLYHIKNAQAFLEEW